MGFVSTSKLAKMFDTSRDELKDAVDEQQPIEGHAVWKWAEIGEDGTIYGFEVPQELLQANARERDLDTGLFGI